MATCFEDCSCECNQVESAFDEIVRAELAEKVTLDHLTRCNIGWFSDQSLGDSGLSDWSLTVNTGLYILWHKDGFCDNHGLYHMRALYVGKGHIGRRLSSHMSLKDFADEMLIYFTYVKLPNRMAKYFEQLLLDVFDLPFNKNENRGRRRLCRHFTQEEVD